VLARTNLITADSGQVFDPNPGASNGGTAPAPDCDSVSNQSKLASQYKTVTLQGIEPGQGKLKGDFVDLTAPGIDPGVKPAGQADSPTHEYVYGCNDDRFEEVMAYYHVDTMQRKLQSLGFTGASAIYGRPIPVSAHYMADCNAFYSPVDRGLHFGDSADPLYCGSIKSDTGEDADVVVHEYGHALQHELVPGWGFGPYPEAEQARSMGEGFGDFIPSVLFGDPCIGEYVNFGQNEGGGKPGLRWLQNDRVYPADFEACPDVDMNGDGIPESEEEHCGGEVWGAALWDLVEALGGGAATPEARDTALRLVIEAHFYLDPLSTFNEAAAAICMVDGLLYSGANSAAIASAFAGRGISSGACVSDDYSYMYLHVRHQWSGDLDLNILVGADPAAPVCSINAADPQPALFFPDVYIGTIVTDFFGCGDFLPPSPSQPWRLEVRDAKATNTGTIEEFQIMLRGGSRCVAPDTPMDVPDNGPAVYAVVDCSVMTGPPGPTPFLPTPTPTPPSAGDINCDGAVNATDTLAILRYAAQMPVSQQDPCPAIGGPGVGQDMFGDLNCDDGVDSRDGLLVLRFISGLDVDQPPGCPPVGPVTPTPSPTPTPRPGTPTPVPTTEPARVTVRNASWHVDPGGYAVVAGEVVNESDRPVGLVRIEASLYGASGQLLEEGAGYSCLTTVPAGSDSPFEVLVFGATAGIESVELTVAQFFDPPFIDAPTGLQGQVTNVYTDAIGMLHAAGSVTNNSGTGYKLVKACVAFYNDTGGVFRAKYSYTQPNILGPSATGTFDASIKPLGVNITNERVWPDGMLQ
jgi:hypothetical protein